ncbi:MAG: FAD:protein FMN transferase [Flavobacteriaceae bacterium]|nr:FAD:protein FMN transferase [Flavobacteriaceae bacterium]
MKLYIYICVFTLTNVLHSQSFFTRKMILMGCGFEISVVAKDYSEADKYIDLAVFEIKRIERIISSWDVNSETSEINRNSGIKPVKVSKELYRLIERSIVLSRLTDGAFDISYASMDKVWKFDGSMKKKPSEEIIAKSVSKVGYTNIILDKSESTVYLPTRGMKIGFGSIGKGYAADMAKQLLISKGVISGIVNASGDMNTWGKQLNGDYWKVAIINPMNKNKNFATLSLKKGAVVTSGNYEKFVSFEGRKYSHIIDPRTGYPSEGIVSVSVFAEKAELADALATSVFVMGIEAGLDRINQLPNTECLLIDNKGKIHSSDNINIYEK